MSDIITEHISTCDMVTRRTNTAVVSFLSVAGTVAVKQARRAAVATPLATVAPSASIKTGRDTTSSAAQAFRLSPNLCPPSLQAEQRRQRWQWRQQLGCLLWHWPGSRPQTAFRLSPAPVERRQRLLLAPPRHPPQPQPPKPTDTRRQRTSDVNRPASPVFTGKEYSRREQYSG